MPCDYVRSPRQTEADRRREIDETLAELQEALGTNIVTITIGQSGAICFDGWENRNGITDVCAYNALSNQDSWELRQAVATAEFQSGLKVNKQAIAAGTHSHDGGQSWTSE